MNVLVYVLVMIAAMLLSVTARIPSTLIGVQVAKAYSERMEQVESQELWNAVQKAYSQEHVLSRQKEEKKKEKIEEGEDNSSEIGERGEEEEEVEGDKSGPLHRRLSMIRVVKTSSSPERRTFQELLRVLFENQEWYREELDRNPHLIDEILEELEKVWEEKKPKSIKALAEIDLHDEERQRFLRRILDNGLLEPNGKSLFLEVSNGPGVSLYLAHKKLLSAMLEDQTLVQEVMQERERLHRELSSRKEETLQTAKESASAELERLFVRHFSDPSWIDFRVTTTKPPRH